MISLPSPIGEGLGGEAFLLQHVVLVIVIAAGVAGIAAAGIAAAGIAAAVAGVAGIAAGAGVTGASVGVDVVAGRVLLAAALAALHVVGVVVLDVLVDVAHGLLGGGYGGGVLLGDLLVGLDLDHGADELHHGGDVGQDVLDLDLLEVGTLGVTGEEGGVEGVVGILEGLEHGGGDEGVGGQLLAVELADVGEESAQAGGHAGVVEPLDGDGIGGDDVGDLLPGGLLGVGVGALEGVEEVPEGVEHGLAEGIVGLHLCGVGRLAAAAHVVGEFGVEALEGGEVRRGDAQLGGESLGREGGYKLVEEVGCLRVGQLRRISVVGDGVDHDVDKGLRPHPQGAP